MEELAGMVLEASDARSRFARGRTEPARKAHRGMLLEKQQPRTSSAAVQLASLMSPGVASILGTKAQKVGKAPMHSLMRLALSQKVCGSSAEAKRAAAAQQVGVALVAKTALSRQSVGLLQWIENPSVVAGSVRAFSGMWDEASQKARARLLDHYLSKGQNVVEVFFCCALSFRLRASMVQNSGVGSLGSLRLASSQALSMARS